MDLKHCALQKRNQLVDVTCHRVILWSIIFVGVLVLTLLQTYLAFLFLPVQLITHVEKQTSLVMQAQDPGRIARVTGFYV